METFYDCIPCFLQQTITVTKLSYGNDNNLKEIMPQVLNKLSKIKMETPPPVVARDIHKIIRKVTNNSDPYKKFKVKYNKKALELYPTLTHYVERSKNPFETAVKIAIAGNIIDFGVTTTVEDINLIDAIEEILKTEPFINDIKDLKSEIDKASKILYLADNTGEIVFDRVFIEHIQPKNITFVVRKSPILNDATYEDAKFVGLTNIVKVIDNGSDIPGTYLNECSQEFIEELESADFIISKGQGNYETLDKVNKKVFYLLKAKCLCITRDIGCKLNDILVIGKNYVKNTV